MRKINSVLRLPSQIDQINQFTPKIFLSKSLIEYPFFPEGFSSKYTVYLKDFPDFTTWKDLLCMYPIPNKILFAQYCLKIKNIINKESLNDLCVAYTGKNYDHQKEELDTLVKLESHYLYLNKNIPTSILKVCLNYDAQELDRIDSILNQTFLKNNIVKDILNIYISLNKKKREQFLDEATCEYKNTHKDSLFFLNAKYKKLIENIKFPEYSFLKEKVDKKILALKLPKNIKINYDPLFEDENLSLTCNIQHKKDLMSLSTILLEKKDKIENLKETLETL